jgi:O-antigen ligase
MGFGLFCVAVALASVWIAAQVMRGELSLLMGAVVAGGALFIATSRYFSVVPLAAYAVLGSDEACKLIAPGAEYVTRLLGAGAVTVLFVRGLATKRLRVPHASVWLFLAFGAWSAITIAWSIDLDSTVTTLETRAGLLLTLLLLSMSEITYDELRLLRRAIIVGACVVSAVALAVYLAELGTVDWDITQGLPRMSGDLPTGEWANPNTLAASLLLPLALSMAGIGSITNRVLNRLALSVMLLAVLVGQSRAAILAIALMLLILSYRFKARMLGVVVVLGIVTVAAWKLLVAMFARFDASDGRTTIWGFALEALSEFWLAGTGAGTFPSISYELGLGAGRYAETDAHNIYVQMAVELGIPGVILFLAGMTVLIVGLGRTTGGNEGPFPPVCLQVALVGLLVYGAFHGILRQKFFWFLIGLSTVVLAQMPRTQEAIEPRPRRSPMPGLVRG